MLEYIAASKNDNRLSVNVLIFTSLVIAVPLVIIVVWLKADYNRHKKPLLEIDPNVKYTFWHHVKVVSIPLMSYRITFMIQKKNDSHDSYDSSHAKTNANPVGAQQMSEQQQDSEHQTEDGVNTKNQAPQNSDTSPLSRNIDDTKIAANEAYAQSADNNIHRVSIGQNSASPSGSNFDNSS